MEWGSVADWAMAVLTAAGFTAAVLQLRSNLRDSQNARKQIRQDEEDTREAMARAVGLKSTWRPDKRGGSPDENGLIPVDVEILNSGPYPIRNALLMLSADDERIPEEVVYGTVLPGEHLKNTYDVCRTEVAFGELTGGAKLLFTDTFDNHWASSTSWQGLERVSGPPRIC